MAVADQPKSDTTANDNPGTVMEEEKKGETELDKYWKAVKENPADFTGWTYLLQYVEQENQIEAARAAFDAFLQRYPYCYGYWKKYADLERKHEALDRASQVFEQGLEAIPLSIDLWIHYINFVTSRVEHEPDKDQQLEALYEKALTAAGTDFLSDKLWDKYILWEKEKKNLQKVTRLYDRLLAIPTQLYSHHFENFSEHVQSAHPKDILMLDEFLRLRQEVITSRLVTQVDPEVEEELGSTGTAISEAPPGADLPPGDDAPPGMDVSTKVDEAEVKAVREKIIELRKTVHQRTEEEVSRRWGYEEGIRRPYFHVKPLERTQLKNWREYLDFEIEFGTHERVVVLFERCMIACALYEDFWIKYAKYMEPHNTEGVRNVYQRACKVHMPKKPNIHLAWAAFEEKQGNFDGAISIIENLESSIPGLAMVSLRKISLQRRRGNFTEASALYKTYMETAETTEVRSFYAIKYARYLSKVVQDYTQAKKVLQDALEQDKENIKLYLQLIDLEYQQKSTNESALMEIFDQAINSDLAMEHRVAFSQRKLEFLEDFGCTVDRLLETYDDHQKLVKELQAIKKRKAETSTEGNAAKKAKTESTTNGSGDQQQSQGHNSTQSMSQQAQQQAAMTNTMHHGHMDPNHYGYGHHQGWGGYQGGYHGYQQGWNYGYGGYGGQ